MSGQQAEKDQSYSTVRSASVATLGVCVMTKEMSLVVWIQYKRIANSNFPWQTYHFPATLLSKSCVICHCIQHISWGWRHIVGPRSRNLWPQLLKTLGAILKAAAAVDVELTGRINTETDSNVRNSKWHFILEASGQISWSQLYSLRVCVTKITSLNDVSVQICVSLEIAFMALWSKQYCTVPSQASSHTVRVRGCSQPSPAPTVCWSGTGTEHSRLQRFQPYNTPHHQRGSLNVLVNIFLTG